MYPTEAAEGLPEEGEAKSVDEYDSDTAANQAETDQIEEAEEVLPEEQQPTQTPEPDPTQAPRMTEPGEETVQWELEEYAPRVDLVRILEWVLGLGALVLGILAWIKRRDS